MRSETAKSGKSAVLPLNKTALETLQGVKHEGEYIFISPRSDTRLNNVSKGWLNLMKRAKKITPSKVRGLKVGTDKPQYNHK